MLGTTLQNRYRLIEELGRGAMGTVYRARDQVLDRDVAIKLISPALFDDAGRARFLREARAVGRLNHPNIVTLYDVAEAEGTPFLVMEVVEGRSLRDALPLAPGAAVDVACHLCRALAHAHARGIVHRDVKPENVLFERREPALSIKLMDFGLSSTQGASRLTRDGMVLGTLAYLAPEQAVGEAVDGRADLYSLGVLLYELVTGRVPFTGGSPQAVLAQHLKAVPVPPREHNPRVPEDLEAFILRLLAKDPASRPESALAALETLAAMQSAAAGESAASAAVAAPRRVRLPEPATEFIARPRELAALRALCAHEDMRLLTLTGPGGTGKTRLALRLAGELALAYPDGACFVELAALSDAALVPATIARALELPEDAARTALETLRDHLETRSMLLVLDNLEQLLPAAPAIAELVRACPGLRVIATSRERLHVVGEQEFAVPPLDLPEPGLPVTASRLARSPAVALFVHRARAVRPDFDLTDANASAIARICGRLDGLPLAIELAAARVRLLPPAALADQLGEIEAPAALDLLTGGSVDAPIRQRTQRTAIAWSHALLDEAEQRLFRRVAVFRGTFSLEAAAHVCPEPGEPRGDFLDRLGSLVEKNLLMARETPAGVARFAMLQTIHEFAAEQLRAAGEVESLERRHFDRCLADATSACSQLKGPRQREMLDELESDLPNVRVALGRAIARGDRDAALRLCNTLRWFWLMRGYCTEGRHWFEVVRAGGGIAPELEAEALHVVGNLAQNQGDLREAAAAFRASLELYRPLQHTSGIASNLGSLGLVSLDRGDYGSAQPLLEEGLGLRRAMGDRSGEADSLVNLSMVAIGLGDFERAEQFGEQSLRMMRELGNSHHASACISNLGQIAMYRGDAARARSLFEESLAIRRELNDDHCSGNSLALLGRLALRGDAPIEAETLLNESVRLLLRAGARASLASALEGLAAAEVRCRKAARAAQLLGAAEVIREISGAGRSPQEQAECDQTVAALRGSLEDGALRAAWVHGRTARVETVIEVGREVHATASAG